MKIPKNIKKLVGLVLEHTDSMPKFITNSVKLIKPLIGGGYKFGSGWEPNFGKSLWNLTKYLLNPKNIYKAFKSGKKKDRKAVEIYGEGIF